MKFLKSLFMLTLLIFSPLGLAEVIDINTADEAAFQRAMKGVGPAKAKEIVQYRTQHGPFKSPDDLLNVKGIGQKTLDDNRANLSVGGGAATSLTKQPAAAKTEAAASAGAAKAGALATPSATAGAAKTEAAASVGAAKAGTSLATPATATTAGAAKTEAAASVGAAKAGMTAPASPSLPKTGVPSP